MAIYDLKVDAKTRTDSSNKLTSAYRKAVGTGSTGGKKKNERIAPFYFYLFLYFLIPLFMNPVGYAKGTGLDSNRRSEQ